ncbi:LytR/AlgR family response regulator transcription factor [Variovorax sp. PBL-E5]|uniref:LytR/AlgR family response regulator transcription factor n=1 Tax=Variovorax sp. PBL-E5 TaxID=434014 RepID=UPI0013182687|nr:LytTR family DNA-binding domain-containing protein [Variovorax sp. PBL-E5]VTU35277.1 Transcriptional regulatory protein YpdB [Variovorax sp. PBL-E5]
MTSLRTLIVDDEALARSRLRNLLADCRSPAAEVVSEAAHGKAALQQLNGTQIDLVLLDIHMPGIDGIELARSLRSRPEAPAIVFVTAHAVHAVTAFELEAVDYLTKPVRAERLQQALQKAERHLKERRAPSTEATQEALVIQDRGRTERVPLAEVLYLKSEYKYLTVRTASRSHILDGSLAEIEDRYPARFVRVHRNALVAREAIRALEKYDDGEDAEGWALRLEGIPEPVAVSRRQLSAVREVLKDPR